MSSKVPAGPSKWAHIIIQHPNLEPLKRSQVHCHHVLLNRLSGNAPSMKVLNIKLTWLKTHPIAVARIMYHLNVSPIFVNELNKSKQSQLPEALGSYHDSHPHSTVLPGTVHLQLCHLVQHFISKSWWRSLGILARLLKQEKLHRCCLLADLILKSECFKNLQDQNPLPFCRSKAQVFFTATLVAAGLQQDTHHLKVSLLTCKLPRCPGRDVIPCWPSFCGPTFDSFRICHCLGPSIASTHFSIGTCQSPAEHIHLMYIWLPLHLRLTMFIEIVNKIWQVTPELGACLEKTLNNFCMSLFAGQLQGSSSIVLRIDRSSRVDQEVDQVQMSLLTGQLQRASSETACDVHVRVSRLRQASHPHWHDNTKAPSTNGPATLDSKPVCYNCHPSSSGQRWLKVSLTLSPRINSKWPFSAASCIGAPPKVPFLLISAPQRSKTRAVCKCPCSHASHGKSSPRKMVPWEVP